ncbi:MAG: HAMP domain-containing sensor histidine kinase [Bdellovibrionota bacterium]
MKSKTTRTSKNTSDDEVERIKLDLLSLVSHELRTPLTSVLNALRMVREEELPKPEKQKFLEMAYRNAERLNATLSQLLDLSKMVSGRLVCRFHEVSLKNLMMTQLEHWGADAETMGFTLECDAKGIADLPVLLGDAPRLEQVLRALFENTFKFSPAQSKIIVKAKVGVKLGALPEGMMIEGAKPEAVFAVVEFSNPVKAELAGSQTTPPGGAGQSGSDVFKIFSQQEAVLDRVHEGVGGSLAIASEVLQQHGGALHAQRKEGIFTVWMALPILDSEDALRKVLESRMYALKTEIGALSLMMLEVEAKGMKQIADALKSALFRATDTVYCLPDIGQIAVVMDDCKKQDAPKIVRRLLTNIGAESGKFLQGAKVGLASSPEDATDPEKLLGEARSNLVALDKF